MLFRCRRDNARGYPSLRGYHRARVVAHGARIGRLPAGWKQNGVSPAWSWRTLISNLLVLIAGRTVYCHSAAFTCSSSRAVLRATMMNRTSHSHTLQGICCFKSSRAWRFANFLPRCAEYGRAR